MKYTVIVGGSPYTVVADGKAMSDDTLEFWDAEGDDDIKVAEFRRDRIDGIIMEDNNVQS